MKSPSTLHYTAVFACLGLASALWFLRSADTVESSSPTPGSSLENKASAVKSVAESMDPARGKPRPNRIEPGTEIVHLIPDQILATVNKEPIQLRHLMPASPAEVGNALTPEEYASRLQRAIDIELVFQAAKTAGVELTGAQQKRLDGIAAGNQAELAHYQKYGISWSTTGPEQVEFEKRLLAAQMLEQNMVAKESKVIPSPDPAVQSRYELARLDLLTQLHASADVAISGPATGP